MKRIEDRRGYVTYMSDSGETIHSHVLDALVESPPGEVFRDETEVHHTVHFPAEAGVKLDLPTAVIPVSRSVHREIHNNVPEGESGDRSICPPLCLILDR